MEWFLNVTKIFEQSSILSQIISSCFHTNDNLYQSMEGSFSSHVEYCVITKRVSYPVALWFADQLCNILDEHNGNEINQYLQNIFSSIMYNACSIELLVVSLHIVKVRHGDKFSLLHQVFYSTWENILHNIKMRKESLYISRLGNFDDGLFGVGIHPFIIGLLFNFSIEFSNLVAIELSKSRTIRGSKDPYLLLVLSQCQSMPLWQSLISQLSLGNNQLHTVE